MTPPLSQQSPSKNWDPVQPLFENLVGGFPPAKKCVYVCVGRGGGGGGGHVVTWISLKRMKLNTKLGRKHFQFPVPLIITFFYMFEEKSVQF